MKSVKWKAVYVWILIWGMFYLLSFVTDCFAMLANKGIREMDGQYYRIFTGLLLHGNLFHVLINMIALYWTAYFLDGKTGEIRLLVFSVIPGVFANAVLSWVSPDMLQSVGGSPVVFGLIGLIAALQITRKDLPGFRIRTACGQWIVGYAVLANIPVFSKDLSTLVIHLSALAAGFVLGMIGSKGKLL